MTDEQNQSEDENPLTTTGGQRRRKPFTRMIDISDQFMYETFEMGADLSGEEMRIQPSNPEARPEAPQDPTQSGAGLGALFGGGSPEQKQEEESPQVTTFSSLLQGTGEFQIPKKVEKVAKEGQPPAQPARPQPPGQNHGVQAPFQPAQSPQPAPQSPFTRPPIPQITPSPQVSQPAAPPSPVTPPHPVQQQPQSAGAPPSLTSQPPAFPGMPEAPGLEGPVETHGFGGPPRTPTGFMQIPKFPAPQPKAPVQPKEPAVQPPQTPVAPPQQPASQPAAQPLQPGQPPVQQQAPTPPPLNSVPLMQVPDLSNRTDLEDLIIRQAESDELEPPPSNEISARHRTIRRADFTRPRIPQLDNAPRHGGSPGPMQTRTKRSFGQRFKEFFHELAAAWRNLFNG